MLLENYILARRASWSWLLVISTHALEVQFHYYAFKINKTILSVVNNFIQCCINARIALVYLFAIKAMISNRKQLTWLCEFYILCMLKTSHHSASILKLRRYSAEVRYYVPTPQQNEQLVCSNRSRLIRTLKNYIW